MPMLLFPKSYIPLIVFINQFVLYLIRKNHPPTNNMKKAFMIVHQVREPLPLNIRLLTEFKDLDPSDHSQNRKIAHFFLYTKLSVYEGELKRIDINNQLTWNQKCISALTDSLSGKRSNIQIRFSEEANQSAPTEMSLICQIETGINIRIFQIFFFKIPQIAPMHHMRRVFMDFKENYSEQQKKLKQEKEKIQQQIKQIVALQKQIEEQTITEISHLKKNFIDVINECKKQLRKHMKTGIAEMVNEQQEIAQEQPISKRRIVRINRDKLQSQANQLGAFLDKPQRTEQNQYMDILFDN